MKESLKYNRKHLLHMKESLKYNRKAIVVRGSTLLVAGEN